MPQSVSIAVVQMNATPDSVGARLRRAENFIAQCAQNGARLVVLPEVFNSGYEYSDNNYLRAESFNDQTATWIKETAARYHVHLAGTFLRKEHNDIFNTLLLAAPDGRQWHYDKSYPWMYERAYFRPGNAITVADTELGKIGFLICWDVAHPNLWQQYAGKVQLMVVSSCPPRALDSTYMLPDGKRVTPRMGSAVRYLQRTSEQTFGELLRRQARFLGVPTAHSSGTGTFNSSLPKPRLSFALVGLLFPSLWNQLHQLNHLRVETGYYDETYIADGSGNVQKCVQPGMEGIAVSTVMLPDQPPLSRGEQPSFGIPSFSYWLDRVMNRIMRAEYRKRTEN